MFGSIKTVKFGIFVVQCISKEVITIRCNFYVPSTLIHEEGHAQAVIDIIINSNNPNYCPSMAPIILLGDYDIEAAKPYAIKKSKNCCAYILCYPRTFKMDRGLTIHPCMDFINDEEIKLCAKAGYDAERIHHKYNKITQLVIDKNWSTSSDKEAFDNPEKFRSHKPCDYSTFTEAYWNFYSVYISHKSCI